MADPSEQSAQDWTAPPQSDAPEGVAKPNQWKVNEDRDGIRIYEVPEPVRNLRQRIRLIGVCATRDDADFIVWLHEQWRAGV